MCPLSSNYARSLSIFRLILFASVVLYCRVNAQPDAFITGWNSFSGPTSCTSCITIPTKGPGYNYDVDWDNDGVYDEFGFTGDASHDYGHEVTNQMIRIRGDFPRVFFYAAEQPDKLDRIHQWGVGRQWTNMDSAFYSCRNLTVAAIDTPDLSQVTGMRAMFFEAQNLTAFINDWDVSNVQDMSYMFSGASGYNQALD
ncbi:MAG: BspA family leucine-rich repeat surface protein, partial [Saprospiraceae bacterium]|nr:BspA family leucine-rich repeat surface protein [Saprospiraceae bacterium]